MNFKLMQAYSADIYLGEVNSLPSCVEICHNPTISEMLLHPELMITKRGMYDNGKDIEEVSSDWDDDVQANMNFFADEAERTKVKAKAPEPKNSAQSKPAEDMPNDDKDEGNKPEDAEE